MNNVNVMQSIFMRSLKRQPVERVPVWLMRQAGRYLPEYQQTRARAGSFLNLCKDPQLACEVTLQPLQRYAFDAAILFSDILTIPDAMGLGLNFIEGEGPRFSKTIQTMDDVDALPVPTMQDELRYVMDAAQLIRRELSAHLPLIGFAGSPWTLACYMIEGGSSRDFKRAIQLMYQQPMVMHQLLNKLTPVVAAYLAAQVNAGVNALMIFDTWGGLLSSANYRIFSLAYMAKIVNQLKIQCPDIPIILFTKGGGQWLQSIADTGCDAIGLDWTCDLAAARLQVGNRVALQGNLDPQVLLTSPACIRAQVKQIIDAYGPGPGHIFNLGHGITPDVPPDHVKVLVDAVHEYSSINNDY